MKDFFDSDGALRAMHRASQKARERAARFGVALPYLENGQIVYLEPKRAQQDEVAISDSAAPVVPPPASSE